MRIAAGDLLGVAGTVWGVTGLLAVFPLNWLSPILGKSKTLLIAILLMCGAQLAKVVCYNPELPYLYLIPTVLLSSGMLMFFTLGSSMVGDICDEDELKTGTRSEGSYYSVYWWFLKTGRAFASFATGALIVLVAFDEKQNVNVDAVRGDIQVIQTNAEEWQKQSSDSSSRLDKLTEQFTGLIGSADELKSHFEARLEEFPHAAEHTEQLTAQTEAFRQRAESLAGRAEELVVSPQQLAIESESLLEKTVELKKQDPRTLFLLRVVEIGLPLVLSLFSIVLVLRYPLTEARCYEIKEGLKNRRSETQPATS